MTEEQEERLPAIQAADEFLPPVAEGDGDGLAGKADRARRRVTGPFQRPQHAIDRVLLSAIEETSRDARGRVRALDDRMLERVGAIEARMDWVELEVARLAAAMEDRERRLTDRMAALEASLALIAARLDGRADSSEGER